MSKIILRERLEINWKLPVDDEHDDCYTGQEIKQKSENTMFPTYIIFPGHTRETATCEKILIRTDISIKLLPKNRKINKLSDFERQELKPHLFHFFSFHSAASRLKKILLPKWVLI